MLGKLVDTAGGEAVLVDDGQWTGDSADVLSELFGMDDYGEADGRPGYRVVTRSAEFFGVEAVFSEDAIL